MKPYIITIARQYGSGGRTVGKMLAKELKIPYYNREIITMASEDSGVNPTLFSDERLKSGQRNRLQHMGDSAYDPSYGTLAKGGPSEEKLFQYQAQAVRKAADAGPCVIVGHCADDILKDRNNVVRVFVHADAEFCLDAAMRVNSLDAESMQKKIAEIDTYRAKYYKYHTGRDWYDARNYDLSINSGVLGFDGALREILSYLELRSQCDA